MNSIDASGDEEWDSVDWDTTGFATGTYTAGARLKQNPSSTWVSSVDSVDVCKLTFRCEDSVFTDREAMEGRVVTWKATLDGANPSFGDAIDFDFILGKADGTTITKSDSSWSDWEDRDFTLEKVLAGATDNKHTQTSKVEAEFREVSFVGTVEGETVDTLYIDVFELWINKFRDSSSSKDWKVVVGEPIEYEANGSTDCTDWEWDMTDGVPDAWNPSGGLNVKSGSTMSIPYSDLSRASNSWFGDRYGTVTVSCKDGDQNFHTLDSSEMSPAKKAKVFFHPDLNLAGGTPSTSNPPAWFVFYKDGNVVDGMSDCLYDHSLHWGAATPSTLSLGPLAVASNSGLEQHLFDMTGSRIYMTGSGSHLDCLAETIGHEQYHIYVWANFSGGTHSDTDWINDSEENSPHRHYFPASDPTNYDRFNYGPYGGGGYEDNEVRARIIELNDIPETYPSKDWAMDPENPQW